MVDIERHDRVGVLLSAEALVGIGRVEGLGCGIEAEKSAGLRVRQWLTGVKGSVLCIDGETPMLSWPRFDA